MPGMFARAQIVEGVNTNAITIPQRTIARGAAGASTVLVVNDENKVEVAKHRNRSHGRNQSCRRQRIESRRTRHCGRIAKSAARVRWSNQFHLLSLRPPIRKPASEVQLRKHHGTIFYRPARFCLGGFHSHHGAGRAGDHAVARRAISQCRAAFHFRDGKLRGRFRRDVAGNGHLRHRATAQRHR